MIVRGEPSKTLVWRPLTLHRHFFGEKLDGDVLVFEMGVAGAEKPEPHEQDSGDLFTGAGR